ncbi:MAG: hypothetical protein V4568_14715 [Pseudomonadota bacterium]
MSTANLAPAIRQQWFNNGVPLNGGFLYSYQATTTTPQNTYTDQGMGTANTNPVQLDPNGQADVWLDPTLAYKFILKDALLNPIWTVDNIVGLIGTNSIPTAAIQDGAVTTAKLAAKAVVSSKLASDASIDTNRAVQTDHIRLAAVTASKLAQSAVSMAGVCNMGLSTSVAASAMTINVTDAIGATPSVSSPVDILFRNATLATGLPLLRQVTAALSIVIPSGASLGPVLTSVNKDIWVYALDNAGTVELAVSGSRMFDETALQTTTAITFGSTSNSTLYSTSARTTVPVRLIGKLISNQTTPGTYAAVATNIAVYSSDMGRQQSEYFVEGANGYGATNTMFRKFDDFASQVTFTGFDVTYASDANLGDSFTVNASDYYSMTYWDNFSAAQVMAITKNDTQGTTAMNAGSITKANVLAVASTTAANQIGCVSVRAYLAAGDVIRAHTQGTSVGTATFNGIGFRIIRG